MFDTLLLLVTEVEVIGPDWTVRILSKVGEVIRCLCTFCKTIDSELGEIKPTADVAEMPFVVRHDVVGAVDAGAGNITACTWIWTRRTRSPSSESYGSVKRIQVRLHSWALFGLAIECHEKYRNEWFWNLSILVHWLLSHRMRRFSVNLIEVIKLEEIIVDVLRDSARTSPVASTHVTAMSRSGCTATHEQFVQLMLLY